ncbi:mannonate dehydratase [Acuticoccus sp. MNP-M23]|uniref:mannonate dehydratase n=1 Tax=Acuticoccus sp. MNP-M23 TaxID=3072793 RepID=UPI002814DA94|nr:mannonate dehydratase [Acuticoccus sp. MNP-M23]WMS44895.1 mannonate dehydratase [Acuticoccus sp. MNP-M23]
MLHTWRWFGPADKTSLTDVAQAGAKGVVSALHHVPAGTVWSPEEIAKRRTLIEDGDLVWSVVESLPVSEEIKLDAPEFDAHCAAWCESLENLAAQGIFVVCYNFMPVIDWTRTDLAWRLPHGGTAMRFDLVDFAAFDIFIAERKGAAEAHGKALADAAAARFEAMDDARRKGLTAAITAGLPGTDRSLTLDDVREALSAWDGISAETLAANQTAFLRAVVPTAERLGMKLCCHPDDPPVPLLGLPRIMSTEADFQRMVDAVESPANGITFCTGSLGARADNDLPGMVERLGGKIHFLHLRNVRHQDGPGEAPYTAFFESDHLDGNVDMVAVIRAVVAEEKRRAAEGRADTEIPMRPDHGHDLADDLKRGAQPGYPTVGRIKGLAELRGVEVALQSRP